MKKIIVVDYSNDVACALDSLEVTYKVIGATSTHVVEEVTSTNSKPNARGKKRTHPNGNNAFISLGSVRPIEGMHKRIKPYIKRIFEDCGVTSMARIELQKKLSVMRRDDKVNAEEYYNSSGAISKMIKHKILIATRNNHGQRNNDSDEGRQGNSTSSIQTQRLAS